MSRVIDDKRSALEDAVAFKPASSINADTHLTPVTSTATNSPVSVSNRHTAVAPVKRIYWTTESDIKYTKFVTPLTEPVYIT